MRQTREIQDAIEMATSGSLKIMGRRPITPAALSVGGVGIFVLHTDAAEFRSN